MECNKDEAKRAMDIAEKKLSEKDYTGAKKFANKAQTLYPHLDGLKQLLMAVDVYISGERQISGEADWYGILGVDPFADDEAVRKQYRKLALLLHPDKNKCKGADGAFKLVSEAWNLLSDKVKRYSYNLKRQVKQRFPTTQSTQPTSSNGFQNVRDHVASGAKARTKPAAASRVVPPVFPTPVQEGSTFWTMCSRCKTQYEFQRVYLNQTLLCPHCRQGFFAAEKTPPPSVPKPTSNHTSNQQKRSSKVPAKTNKNSSFGARDPASSVNNGFQWEPLSRNAGSSDSRNVANQAANVVQQAQERLKRAYAESQERDSARGFTNSDLENYKKMKTDVFGSFSYNWSNQNGPSRFTNPPETQSTFGSRRPQVEGILLPSDMKRALVKKAQSDISKRLMAEAAELMKAMEIEKKKKSMKETSKMMASKADEVEKRSTEPVKEASNDDEVNSIVVPDPDFHNFDLDRTETAFGDDEIWAAYDEDDGMPRYYARIQKVVSLDPFKMRISWLNTKTCKEFAPVDWVGFGFAKSCGDFRTSKYELNDALNAFSHKVDFTKGAKGLIHIFPKKGQVWALYRHWSPDWNGDTPDEVKHKYDMVEVLDYYTEDKQSLTVAPLLKAERFKSVFRRSTDHNNVRKIPKEEMFRFSHQVPHYILTGKEAENAPEGCVELDPAAIPWELLSENTESCKMDTERSKPVKEKSTAPEEEVMGMNID